MSLGSQQDSWGWAPIEKLKNQFRNEPSLPSPRRALNEEEVMCAERRGDDSFLVDIKLALVKVRWSLRFGQLGLTRVREQGLELRPHATLKANRVESRALLLQCS